MKSLKSSLLATIFMSAVILFGIAENKTQADAELMFDSCKDVKFTFRNGRADEIQITKVHYYNQNEGKWKTETIPYNSCYSSYTCYLPPQNLGDSEGDNITKIKFEYKTRPNRSSGNWSGNFESEEFQPNSPSCRANRNYGSASWIISPSGSTGGSNNRESDSTSDKCKRVEFKVTNGRNEEIEISKVKFFNRSSGQWKTEGIRNVNCGVGQTCTLSQNDIKIAVNHDDSYINLSDANGDDITKVIFIYKYKAGGRGANWSDLIESRTFEPTSPNCREGKVFGTGQLWTIGGNGGATSNTAPENSGSRNSIDSNAGNSSVDAATTNNRQRGRRNRNQTVNSNVQQPTLEQQTTTTVNSNNTQRTNNARQNSAVRQRPTAIQSSTVQTTTTETSDEQEKQRRKRKKNKP